jgi:hypothetical protein
MVLRFRVIGEGSRIASFGFAKLKYEKRDIKFSTP